MIKRSAPRAVILPDDVVLDWNAAETIAGHNLSARARSRLDAAINGYRANVGIHKRASQPNVVQERIEAAKKAAAVLTMAIAHLHDDDDAAVARLTGRAVGNHLYSALDLAELHAGLLLLENASAQALKSLEPREKSEPLEVELISAAISALRGKKYSDHALEFVRWVMGQAGHRVPDAKDALVKRIQRAIGQRQPKSRGNLSNESAKGRAYK
jgi:hypothetical protein